MATLKRRFTFSILFSFLSLTAILLLLARQRVSTHLQSLTLATGIHEYTGGIFRWDVEEEEEVEEGGVRMVVFGDSWADDKPESGMSGKGKSWVRTVCEEIGCTSYFNYAATQPTDDYPSNPPKGALAMNDIHIATLEESTQSHIGAENLNLLPDLGAQIQSYITENPPSKKPMDTIFVVSLGFWDVYNFASLDFDIAINATDASVEELFYQLDVLYSHHAKSYPAHTIIKADNTTNPPLFPVIIPNLLDPSLVPGWISHRPLPIRPSSIAEQQKNAMYLTNRWNFAMENKMISWMKGIPIFYESEEKKNEELRRKASEPSATNATKPIAAVRKDIFYFDIAQQILDMLVEYQMEDTGISDARGLGTGFTPYENIYQACLRESEDEEDDEEEFLELNGHLLCKNPDEYLYWDAFNVGSLAKVDIGKEVAQMIKEGDSLRRQLSKGSSNGAGGI